MKFAQVLVGSAFARLLLLQSFIIVFCLRALAQVAEVVPVTNSELFQFILENFGNFKGAGTIVLVNLIAQILMKFLGTPLFDGLKLDPKYKFLFFAIMQMAISITGVMLATNVSFGEAVMSSGLLLTIVNYGYRIYELFFEKKK